jgi:hypothetical protein
MRVMVALPPPVWADKVVKYHVPHVSVGADAPDEATNHEGVAEKASAAVVGNTTAKKPPSIAVARLAFASELRRRDRMNEPVIEAIPPI